MIGFEITKLFFDKQAVTQRVDRTTRRVLSKFGSFVRQTARRSIRNAPFLTKKPRGQARTDFRRATSPSGHPPYSHTGLLKKFIFFGYDPGRNSVVIGPVRLSQKGRGEAPALLEYGGSATLVRRGSRRRARFRPRPFMGPAFEKEHPKLPAMWRDSIPRK